MRKFPRFLKLLPVLALVLVLLTTAAMAADETFDKDTFVGLVLRNDLPGTTKNDVAVTLYKGFSTSSSNRMTAVYTETVDGVEYAYYEVTAGSKYTCIAKTAASGSYTFYNEQRTIYITADEAAKKTVLDVTPTKRSTSGWDPSGAIYQFTDEAEVNYLSDPALWPQYADMFTTPAFQEGRNKHRQTTQTEMMNFINGLNGADDNMYVYTLGKSSGRSSSEYFDIPLVIFTNVDLTGADTLEEAAALIKADSKENNKLTIHYQAQIHGYEPASGEAALGMIKRLDGNYGEGLLDTMNIYVIPRLSPNAAYRNDRYVYISDDTTTDPNRDFLRLNTTETTLRMKAYNLFDPEVVFDGHEYREALTSTSYAYRDLQLCSHFLPTFTQEYQDTAVELALAAQAQLKADNMAYTWYGNSVNGIGPNTGSSNTAYRAALHILMESHGINLGLHRYERRVAAHASALTGMLAYLDENAAEVKAAVQTQRDIIVENGKTYKEDDILILDGTSKKADGTTATREDLAIEGHTVNMVTGALTETTFPAYVAEVVNRSRVAPTAYVIPAGESYTQTVLDRMDKQGITYDFIPEGSSINLQQYTVVTTNADGVTKEAGLTDEQIVTFHNGAYAFTMDQVDGLILACLMEPDVNDNYNSDAEIYLGSFVYDNIITATDNVYPIYRYIRDLNDKGEIDYAALSEAPEGLETVGATKIGGTGSITGLDAARAYEYRTESEGSYTAVPAGTTEITDLPVGKYYVRFAKTENSEASADTLVEIGYGVLDEYVVYLDATNGLSTNDGYTEAAPVNTIDLAYSQLTALMESAPAGTTGKIVNTGTYNISGSRVLPAHDYPLLITGGTLKLTPASDDSYPYLGIGGETTFDNITLLATKSSYLCGEGNKMVIGANVTTGTSTLFNINGGGHYRTTETINGTDVTVKSGTWSTAYAGGYTIKTNGNARLVLENCKVSRVTNSYNVATSGNVYYSLKNVQVTYGIYCGNTKQNSVGGDVTLVLGEGVTTPEIYAGSRDSGNVTGKVTVIADGIDLTANPIYGKAKNATGTIGGLKLVVNKGELADVADTFVTRDGVDIVLGCDQTKTATLNYSCNLDLNGCDATITVADGKTLTVCDTATDDFKVLDAQGYGILSATGTTVAKEGYVVREEEGGKSYHRRELKLDNVVLRPSATGIYYTGQFGLNELYRGNVESYGVVLSLDPDPILGKDGCAWTVLTQWPDTGAGYGTVLQGIMTQNGGYSSNKANAERVVYGVAYIKYTDDTVEYSNHAQRTLRQVVEASDAIWNDLTQPQKEGLLAMYGDFAKVMRSWNIPNIQAEA